MKTNGSIPIDNTDMQYFIYNSRYYYDGMGDVLQKLIEEGQIIKVLL